MTTIFAPLIGTAIVHKPEQLLCLPTTRYMGSKYKLLDFIWESVKDLSFGTVLDPFAGTGCVSYMFKCRGKNVVANDMLKYSFHNINSLIANNHTILTEDDIDMLLNISVRTDKFIRNTFRGLYFSDEDYLFLEQVSKRINFLDDDYKKSIAMGSLCRSCVKKRPRGLFTYIGNRYDDGRRDLSLSMKEQFIESVDIFNAAVFDNSQNNGASCEDVFTLNDVDYDLVYLDPPYCSTKSDNDYLRRYHFVEGLCSYWKEDEIDFSTKTRKIMSKKTGFNSIKEIHDSFDRLFEKFSGSILVVSYSSNSVPTKEDMITLLKRYKKNVEVREMPYTYTCGNGAEDLSGNYVKEYLFIAY